jgi:HSP20 family protein
LTPIKPENFFVNLFVGLIPVKLTLRKACFAAFSEQASDNNDKGVTIMFDILPWNHPSEINIRRNRAPLSSLQTEINRVFDDFFGSESSFLPASCKGDKLAAPIVDIVENDKSFKVEAELPGIHQDDIEVTVNEHYLTIKGEKKESKEDTDENYVRRERHYGSYQRTISLPETANTDKAKATFKKGVLWVEVPKKEEAIKPTKKLDSKAAA